MKKINNKECLCLSNHTLKRFLIRVPHDGLPAGVIGQQVGIGITTPPMGCQHDPFGHPVIDAGLHVDPAPVGFDHYWVTVLKAIFLSGFRSNLGQGFREKFPQGLDLVMLAMGILQVAVAHGKDQGVFFQK